MTNLLSGIWDFIVWLFPWLLIGIVVGIYYGFIETEISNSKAKEREYLFISITLSAIAGLVIPFYLRTSDYWTAPLVFWAGFLTFLSIGFYWESNFVWGIFGLGNASITEYILSFYNDANAALIFILRFVFLFFVGFAGVKFAQFLNSATKRRDRKKKSITSKETDIEDTTQPEEVEREALPVPRKTDIEKNNGDNDDIAHNKGWENTIKIISAILGLLLLLTQIANQALDVLKKIP